MNGLPVRIILACALVVSAPALWGTAHGTVTVDAALTRFLLALVGCWVAVAVVAGVWRHNETQAVERQHRVARGSEQDPS